MVPVCDFVRACVDVCMCECGCFRQVNTVRWRLTWIEGEQNKRKESKRGLGLGGSVLTRLRLVDGVGNSLCQFLVRCLVPAGVFTGLYGKQVLQCERGLLLCFQTHTQTHAHKNVRTQIHTHTHEDVGALSNLAWLESYSQKQQLAAFWFELVGLRWGWGKQVE